MFPTRRVYVVQLVNVHPIHATLQMTQFSLSCLRRRADCIHTRIPRPISKLCFDRYRCGVRHRKPNIFFLFHTIHCDATNVAVFGLISEMCLRRHCISLSLYILAGKRAQLNFTMIEVCIIEYIFSSEELWLYAHEFRCRRNQIGQIKLGLHSNGVPLWFDFYWSLFMIARRIQWANNRNECK